MHIHIQSSFQKDIPTAGDRVQRAHVWAEWYSHMRESFLHTAIPSSWPLAEDVLCSVTLAVEVWRRCPGAQFASVKRVSALQWHSQDHQGHPLACLWCADKARGLRNANKWSDTKTTFQGPRGKVTQYWRLKFWRSPRGKPSLEPFLNRFSWAPRSHCETSKMSFLGSGAVA